MCQITRCLKQGAFLFSDSTHKDAEQSLFSVEQQAFESIQQWTLFDLQTPRLKEVCDQSSFVVKLWLTHLPLYFMPPATEMP